MPGLGRPYAEITKTCTLRLPADPAGRPGAINADQAIEQLARLAALGIDQALVTVPEPIVPSTIDLFGERIVPAATKFAVAGR